MNNYNIKTLEIEYKPQNKEIFYNGILIKSSGSGMFDSVKFDLPDFGELLFDNRK